MLMKSGFSLRPKSPQDSSLLLYQLLWHRQHGQQGRCAEAAVEAGTTLLTSKLVKLCAGSYSCEAQTTTFQAIADPVTVRAKASL